MKPIPFIVFTSLLLIGLISCKSKKMESSNSTAKSADSSEAVPQWITMMNDSNVNYYAAVEAFNKYWENRERPAEDDGEGRDIFDKEEGEKEKKSIEYVYEYKQFLNWQLRNKDFVKPDGTIMTPDEIKEQSEAELKKR